MNCVLYEWALPNVEDLGFKLSLREQIADVKQRKNNHRITKRADFKGVTRYIDTRIKMVCCIWGELIVTKCYKSIIYFWIIFFSKIFKWSFLLDQNNVGLFTFHICTCGNPRNRSLNKIKFEVIFFLNFSHTRNRVVS